MGAYLGARKGNSLIFNPSGCAKEPTHPSFSSHGPNRRWDAWFECATSLLRWNDTRISPRGLVSSTGDGVAKKHELPSPQLRAPPVQLASHLSLS